MFRSKVAPALGDVGLPVAGIQVNYGNIYSEEPIVVLVGDEQMGKESFAFCFRELELNGVKYHFRESPDFQINGDQINYYNNKEDDVESYFDDADIVLIFANNEKQLKKYCDHMQAYYANQKHTSKVDRLTSLPVSAVEYVSAEKAIEMIGDFFQRAGYAPEKTACCNVM